MILKEDWWLLVLCFILFLTISFFCCYVPDYVNELDDNKIFLVQKKEPKKRDFLFEHFWLVKAFFCFIRVLEFVFILGSTAILSIIVLWVFSAHKMSVFPL